jgi:hypothetical protein
VAINACGGNWFRPIAACLVWVCRVAETVDLEVVAFETISRNLEIEIPSRNRPSGDHNRVKERSCDITEPSTISFPNAMNNAKLSAARHYETSSHIAPPARAKIAGKSQRTTGRNETCGAVVRNPREESWLRQSHRNNRQGCVVRRSC